MGRHKVHKVLFAATTLAHKNHQVDFADEYDEIQEKLRGAKYKNCFMFRPIFRLEPDNLHLALKEERPSIVHFSCPGESQKGLMLGKALMSGDELRELFASFKDHVRLVVLNACYSKAQAVHIREVVDCVVGMESAIKDVSCRKFSSFFYHALANGESVHRAWESGCASIGINALDDESAPRILTREGVHADKLFFAGEPSETQPSSRPLETKTNHWIRKQDRPKRRIMLLPLALLAIGLLGLALLSEKTVQNRPETKTTRHIQATSHPQEAPSTSDDQTLLTAASEDEEKTVRIWSKERKYEDQVGLTALCPEGKAILSASTNGKVQLFLKPKENSTGWTIGF